MADDRPFHRRDAISPAIYASGVTGAAGLVAAAVQSTLTRRNIGMFGAFTHYGGTIGVMAAMGGTYEFFRHASANLREKDDSWNEALGGFVSGAMVGLRCRC